MPMKLNSSRILHLIWCIFVCTSGSVWGVDNHWTGAAGDNLWTNAANWSLGVLPNSNHNVFIDQPASSVTLNAPADVGTFSLGGSSEASLIITNGILQCYGSGI